FADVEAVVELSVDDQRRRLEIFSRIPRRPFFIHLRVRIRSALELPVIEPELFGSSPGRHSVKHAVMRHDALEAIRMPKHPVRHVSAITRAQSALAVLVDKGISLLRVIEPLHQIFKRSAAPIAIDRVDKLLPISRRSMKIDLDDHISTSRKKLRIPAIAPLIAHRNLRSTMN